MLGRLPLMFSTLWVAYLATVQSSYFWWATGLLTLTAIGILGKKGMAPKLNELVSFRGISISLVIIAPILMVLSFYNFSYHWITFTRDLVFYAGITAAGLEVLDWLMGGKSD